MHMCNEGGLHVGVTQYYGVCASPPAGEDVSTLARAGCWALRAGRGRLAVAGAPKLLICPDECL